MKNHLPLVGAICTVICLMSLGTLIFHRNERPVERKPDSSSTTQQNSQPLPISDVGTTTPASVSYAKSHPPTAAAASSSANPPTLLAVRQQGAISANREVSQSSRISSSLPTSNPKGSMDMEEVIPVPLGAQLPAALVDPAPDATAEQAVALDNLADDFLNSTAADPDSTNNGNPTTPKDAEENWNSAASEANERYRSLFGVEAYNAWTTAAAKEALAEKQ